MNQQNISVSANRHKTIIIYLLYTGASFIFLLGVFFTTYAILKDITFQLLMAKVPGFTFGLLVAYLGIRYFFMVEEFKPVFLSSSEKFSWANFKKEKKKKGRKFL